MMKDWNNRNKFWAETVRMIVIACVSGYLAFKWLNPYERSQYANLNYKAEIDKQRLAIQTRLVDDFLVTSYGYMSVIYDLLNKEKDISSNEVEKSYDSYRSQQNQIRLYFHRLDSVSLILNEITHSTDSLYQFTKSNSTKDKEWKEVRNLLKTQNNKLGIYILKEIDFFKTAEGETDN